MITYKNTLKQVSNFKYLTLYMRVIYWLPGQDIWGILLPVNFVFGVPKMYGFNLAWLILLGNI